VVPLREPLTINLLDASWNVTFDANDNRRATGVRCFDLLDRVERTYTADRVVISAGTLESTKIALQSGINQPQDRPGRHGPCNPLSPLRHPSKSSCDRPTSREGAQVGQDPSEAPQLQPGTSMHSTSSSSFGAEFNQGRYVNADHLGQDQNIRNGYMLCEIVTSSSSTRHFSKGQLRHPRRR
jgi:hypothetical protein